MAKKNTNKLFFMTVASRATNDLTNYCAIFLGSASQVPR
jgi:hypothetical protein